jgi:Thioredoxin like C-terminal domain
LPGGLFIDTQCRIRHHAFAEGNYQKSEQIIQELLRQAGKTNAPTGFVSVDGAGVEAAPDRNDIDPPETYIGYDRAQNFISRGGEVQDASRVCITAVPELNEWALLGNWTVCGQQAVLNEGGGGQSMPQFRVLQQTASSLSRKV